MSSGGAVRLFCKFRSTRRKERVALQEPRRFKGSKRLACLTMFIEVGWDGDNVELVNGDLLGTPFIYTVRQI